MSNKIKDVLLILAITLFLFYLLPLCYYAFNAELGKTFLILLLFFMYPIYVFSVNLIYVIRYSFLWYLPILVGVAFFPSIFIYYNISAGIYTLVYMIFGYIGMSIGYLMDR